MNGRITADRTTPEAPDDLVWIRVEGDDGDDAATVRLSPAHARAFAARLVALADKIEEDPR